ncbi:histidine phosphatase family protein [Parvibaculum lavamentivorans]
MLNLDLLCYDYLYVLNEKVILLARHGTTHWTQEGLYNSHTDVPLIPAGRDEILRAAHTVIGRNVKNILCSPLRRTRESAAIFSDTLGVAVETDERLRELNFGLFEGQTRRDLSAPPFADEFFRWTDETVPYSPPGVESFSTAKERIVDFIRDTIEIPGPTLVVSHGVILRILLCVCVLGIEPHHFRRLQIDVGSISEIRLDRSRLQLWTLNTTTPRDLT